MLYRYDTHVHTSEGSLCGESTADEMARKFKEEGYDGIFITDHFFNGNCAIPQDLPWEERVEMYCLGYEHALATGREIGLDVFFGVEYGDGRADFLTYGVDKAWLCTNPEIMDMKIEDYIALVRQNGGMVIQAHPFREAPYIDHFTLVPAVDGVETLNASNRMEVYNERAKWYAESFDLPQTAGSDSHSTGDRFRRGGIITDFRITSPADYIAAVKERRITAFISAQQTDG